MAYQQYGREYMGNIDWQGRITDPTGQSQPQAQQQASTPQAPEPTSIDVSQGSPAPMSDSPAPALTGAAPAGAMPGLASAAPPTTGGGGQGMPAQAPTLDQPIMTGPNSLRQGIGQRQPPDLTPALIGLRRYY